MTSYHPQPRWDPQHPDRLLGRAIDFSPSRHTTGTERVPQWHWELLAETERHRYEGRWYRRLWRWAVRAARRITG